MPRLSVDMDLDYAENVSRENLPEVKERIKKRLTDYMWQEGYGQADIRESFALSSYTFSYINNAGNRDNIKIEINFLDRCHILPLEHKMILTKGIVSGVEILTLNKTELYGSKINALLSRATPRDLYDVNAMIKLNVIEDETMLKRCLIFYNAIAGDYDIESYNYKNVEALDFKKYRTQLKPVIAKDDPFNIESAKQVAIAYIKKLLVLTEREKEFLFKFKEKVYAPELLFDDAEIVENIKYHPAALWRTK